MTARPDVFGALRALYYAFGPMSDPDVEAWWEARAEEAAEYGRSSDFYRNQALSFARGVLAQAGDGEWVERAGKTEAALKPFADADALLFATTGSSFMARVVLAVKRGELTAAHFHAAGAALAAPNGSARTV